MVIKIGKWVIRPEVDELLYWLHLVIIWVSWIFIMKNLFGISVLQLEFTFDIAWKAIAALGLSDILAHSLLKLD